MPQQSSHPSRLSVAGLLLLCALQASAADSRNLFSGGGTLSHATPSSGDGRFSVDARLQPAGATSTSPSKQTEPAPFASPNAPAQATRFALSAALSRRGDTPKGALACGPVDAVFQNGFE